LFHYGKGLKGAEVTINNPTISDEGVYNCIIKGDCGTVYTNNFNIFLGYEDILTCAGSDTVLTARKHKLDKGQMKYYWVFRNNKLKEVGRYEGASTLSLKVKSITSSQGGVYNLYAFDPNLNKTYSNGFIYLDVASAPKISREYYSSPIKMKAGKTVKMMSVISKKSMKIELFKGNELINFKWFGPKDWTDIEYTFYIGCNTAEPSCAVGQLESGNYKFKFTNDCGETWSKEFTVINLDTAKGIVYNPDSESETGNYETNFELTNSSEISNNDQLNVSDETENTIFDNSSFIIYPNPAGEFITINLDRCATLPKCGTSSVEIYDIMGIKIHTTPSASQPPLQEGNLKIDISHLATGVYFVKFGDRVAKFVKI